MLRTLADEGISPVVNSHITPLPSTRRLYHNRSERVIFFDDVDSHLRFDGSPGAASVLSGVIPRIVTYGSSQLDDLPGSFIFESRIVFCGECDPQAERRLQGCAHTVRHLPVGCDPGGSHGADAAVASAGYESLTPDDCLEVVDFIEQNGDDRAISLRLLEPSFRKVIYARSEGLDWRPLVMTQLKTLGRKEDTSRTHRRQGSGDSHSYQAIERFPTP